MLTEGEVGFGIPTLLRTEAGVVGVVRSNEVSFHPSDRARIARVSSFSTSFACHARIHNLVGLLVWRLQSLHEKVHLGSKHIDTVDMVDSLMGLLLPFTFPTLVGSNLLYQRFRCIDAERKEGTSWSCIDVVLGWCVQAIEETLNNQPFLHAVVGACCDVFLESLPSF